MNAPIQALYASGNTLYAILISPDDGTVWNNVSLVWQTYSAPSWSQYAVPLSEYPSSGYYRAAYPVASPLWLSTDVIYVQAGLSPALGDSVASGIYQSQGSNIGSVGNLWQSAQNMAFALGTQQVGTIVGTPSSSISLPTNLVNPEVDAYAGRAIIMTSGILIQQASPITAYDQTTSTLTIIGFPSGDAPSNGDAFVII